MSEGGRQVLFDSNPHAAEAPPSLSSLSSLSLSPPLPSLLPPRPPPPPPPLPFEAVSLSPHIASERLQNRGLIKTVIDNVFFLSYPFIKITISHEPLHVLIKIRILDITRYTTHPLLEVPPTLWWRVAPGMSGCGAPLPGAPAPPLAPPCVDMVRERPPGPPPRPPFCCCETAADAAAACAAAAAATAAALAPPY